MPAANRRWDALPHGPLIRLADNILTVTGEIGTPIGTIPRRMTVVRLNDCRLVVYSAMALDAEGMRSLEAFGDPAFLIIPGARHRLDVGIWKHRYPRARVIAPAAAAGAARKVVAVDATSMDFGDPSVRLVDIAGMGARELALEVGDEAADTVLLNDVVFNLPRESGIGGCLRGLIGFSGAHPHVPGAIRRSWVDDKAALAAQLRDWATPSLRRVIVSHGPIIDRDPSDALRRIADDLD